MRRKGSAQLGYDACGKQSKVTHSNEAPSVEVDDVVRTASGLLDRTSVAIFLRGLLEKTTKCVDIVKVGSGFRQNIQVLPGSGSTVAVDPSGEGSGCLSLGRLGAGRRVLALSNHLGLLRQ